MIALEDRPCVREMVGRALRSSHLEDGAEGESGLRAVHRIAALAKVSRLASASWRVKLAHDAASWDVAIGWLERKTAKALRLPTPKPGQWRLRRACEQAMREWLSAGCEECSGAGWRLSRTAERERCRACFGSGDRPWTDENRAEMLRVPVESLRKDGRSISWIDQAKRCLREADSHAGVKVSQQLGMRAA